MTEMERHSSGSAQNPALRMSAAVFFLQGQVPLYTQKQLKWAGLQEALSRLASAVAGCPGCLGQWSATPTGYAENTPPNTPTVDFRVLLPVTEDRQLPLGRGVQDRAAPHCSSWPPA